jgi:hypothetical protein
VRSTAGEVAELGGCCAADDAEVAEVAEAWLVASTMRGGAGRDAVSLAAGAGAVDGSGPDEARSTLGESDVEGGLPPGDCGGAHWPGSGVAERDSVPSERSRGERPTMLPST